MTATTTFTYEANTTGMEQRTSRTMELAGAIAAALGGVAQHDAAYEWRHDTWAYILLDGATAPGVGGPSLSLHFNYSDGKVNVRPVWPKDRNGAVSTPYYGYGERGPEINVGLTKTPERIAADIERRLLADYRPMYQEQAERVARDIAKYAAGMELRDHLASFVPGARILDKNNRNGLYGGFDLPYNTNRALGLHVEAGYGGESVREIKLTDLTPEQAEAVLAFIGKHLLPWPTPTGQEG